MHKTEGTNNVNNLFTSGPPGTNVDEYWLNALQTEVCYVITSAGLALKTQATDTMDQLKAAIDILAVGSSFASGTKMYFYQNVAPTGWTLDAVPADALLAVKGGADAYNAAGGTQQGTWTQPNHTHAVGTYQMPLHLHAVGTYQMPAHTHGAGTLQAAGHGHADTFTVPNHQHIFDYTAVGSKTSTLGDFVTTGTDVPADGEYMLTHDNTAGASTINFIEAATQTDGGGGSLNGSVTGAAAINVFNNTASDGPTAITGSSANTGPTAITGTSANGATANTWRPLAQVGIIATKD